MNKIMSFTQYRETYTNIVPSQNSELDWDFFIILDNKNINNINDINDINDIDDINDSEIEDRLYYITGTNTGTNTGIISNIRKNGYNYIIDTLSVCFLFIFITIFIL